MKTTRHSIHRLFAHLIWTTASRASVLDDDFWRHAQGSLNALSDPRFGVLACGGDADHMHLLAAFRPDARLSSIVHQVKGSLSFWLRRQGKIPSFRWQEGFAAYSVSEADLPRLIRYIAQQRDHHSRNRIIEPWECPRTCG